MPWLFSYGTLQEAPQQRRAFGRVLRAVPDSLPGYALDTVLIADAAVRQELGIDRFSNVVAGLSPSASVTGLALEVTPEELALADAYEAPYRYERVEVVLRSGREAWVYRYAGP
ncbi:MAG: gamma-glutamylcyclotransferase family protein [Burkholderiales bacterium]